jgi:hypothetical protein
MRVVAAHLSQLRHASPAGACPRSSVGPSGPPRAPPTRPPRPRRRPPPAPASAAAPRVRPHCRFRNRGAYYDGESGMRWAGGRAERQCDRAPGRASSTILRCSAVRAGFIRMCSTWATRVLGCGPKDARWPVHSCGNTAVKGWSWPSSGPTWRLLHPATAAAMVAAVPRQPRLGRAVRRMAS